MKTVVSAPVSVCLSGYSDEASDTPRLLTATQLRVAAVVENQVSTTRSTLIKSICSFLTKEQGITINKTLGIKITSPLDSTISTSACVTALIGVLIYHERHVWNPIAINQLAHAFMNAEKVDDRGLTTTSTVGGFVWYRRELPFLQSVWQLPIKLNGDLQHFYLTKTNSKKSAFLTEDQTKEVTIALKAGKEADLATILTPDSALAIDKNSRWRVGYQPQQKQAILIKIGEEGIRLEEKFK